MKRKILIAIAITIVAILTFLTWYKLHYSMGVAEPFEVNSPDQQIKVLIATQGSDFKNAVVEGVVEYLKQKPAYIKVVDVSALSQIDEEQWGAIVVIHTWENLKPQEDAKAYLDRAKDLTKVVVLTTSGDGDYKIDGINAITSASEMTNVSMHVTSINDRLKQILKDK